MSKEKNKGNAALLDELFGGKLEEALAALKESNKHARKRNRVAKRQHKQSVLNYEQLERQYLIEKSSMQPRFRLSVTEFLLCGPDFLNDPELATEAKYLTDLGHSVDERVLRFRVDVKGSADYMRPNLVIGNLKQSRADERASSMTELLFFVAPASIEFSDEAPSFPVYFVYRDQTTLPVIHKYRVWQLPDSTLLRWEISHLDTAYASSRKNLSALNSAAGCEALFADG